ncbi:MAG TPA: hypothetical protein V6D47_21255 [Oscillatoriaceae cyanobacterium]
MSITSATIMPQSFTPSVAASSPVAPSVPARTSTGDTLQLSTQAPSPKKAHHGIGGFFKKTVHAVGDVAIGAASEVKDQGQSIVGLARHPKQTAQGLASTVTHPVRTLRALGKDGGSNGGKPESLARHIGHMVGSVGLGVLSSGGTTIAQTVGTVSTVSHYTDPASDIVDAGNDDDPTLRQGSDQLTVGGVATSFAHEAIAPVTAVAKVARHPKRLLHGVGAVIKHPSDAVRVATGADVAGPKRAPDNDPNHQLGRGIFRATTMAMGLGAFGQGLPQAYGKYEKTLSNASQAESIEKIGERVDQANTAN